MAVIFDPSGLPTITFGSAFTSRGINRSLSNPATQKNETSSTSLKFSNNGASIEYDGTGFTYAGGLITGGTINHISEQIAGQTFIDISQASVKISDADLANPVDAETVADYVKSADLLLGGDDNILTSLDNNNADNIYAGAGNDTVVSGFGNDTILGNQGDDVLLGNQDDDVVVGGKDQDIVVGGQGNDIVFGNEGNDITFGNQGQDTVFAGQGDDTVYAGEGNDLIFGNQGNDTLFGNQGADTFSFTVGDGADLVMDFSAAEGDKLDVQGLSHTTSQAANGDAVITLFGGGTIELQGIAAVAVTDAFFKV